MKSLFARASRTAARVLSSVVCLVAAVFAALPATAATVFSTNEGLVTTANEPVSVTALANGHTVLDFGRNAAGWLQFEAPQTGAYKIIAGELLNADGTVNTRDAGSQWNCYYTWVTNPADNKNVKTSVRYIVVESSVTEVGTHRVPFDLRWQKRFDTAATVKATPEIGSITTFRYVEIVTPPPGVPPSGFRRMMVHHDFDWDESSFTSSDETLNKVYDLCKWTIYADSFLGYWVDGDRERKLYEADQFTIQNAAFGLFSDNAVTHRSTKALMDNEWARNGIFEWAQFVPLLIHNDWFLSGDTSIPSGYWAKIPKCGQHTSIFTQFELENGLIAPNSDTPSIVDHPPCYHYGYDMKNSGTDRDDTDGRLLPIENALHYAQHRAMAEMATALGKTSEAATYAAKADKIYQSYNATFFDASAGLYRDKLTTDGYVSTHHSVLANAYALAFDLVPADKMAYVANYVATNQVKQGMACSSYAAHYLLEGLCKAGRADAAIAYMTATTENSWVNMMREGLTTAGEAWSLYTGAGSNLYDLSHAWGCAPAHIIPRYVLGVRPAAAGWAKAVVAPQFGSLTQAHGKVPTTKGSVEVDYRNQTLTVTVPTGMAADVTFAGVTKTVAANAATRTITIGGDTPTPQPAETPLTVSDQASWTAWMQGVDTEEKLAAVKAAVSGKAAVKIAIANFEAGHDDFQVSQMTAMAAYYGLAVEIKQVEPTNPDAGRTLDVVYRDAFAQGDIVIDFKSYWTQDECDRAASVIANCPEKLFILPYGEAGSPVPPTSQSLQGRARHADGSGLANLLLTIPLVKEAYGTLTTISRRAADDTETAAFVSASGWADGKGDTCQSASMAAIAAAWITAARGDAPSAAEIVRLLEAGRGLPSATDQESVAFTAADRETLQAKIAEYATADAQGRKKLLNDAPLNLGVLLRQLPEGHVHSWGAWTTAVAATCEGYGYETRACSAAGCADREQRQTLLPLGHDWGAWTDDPSDPSRQVRSCVRAGCTATEARAFHVVGDAGWGWQKTVTEGTAKYEVLVFTNVADQWTFVLPEGVSAINYVVVAGGGGGGAGNAYAKIRGGGGGGAGGLLHGTQPGTGRLIASVGKGGAAGKNGFDSTLCFGGVELTAVGGGAGVSDNGNGKDGGSGGGGGGKSSGSKGGAGVEGQGHEGGGYGGGGGGYAAAGTKGKAGAGGAGYEDPISGLTLAVGGRGGTPEGEDGNRNGASGLASTGNGGEGAFGLGWTPGAGGSGAVIVRYQVSGGGEDPHVDPEHPIVPLELSKIFQSNMVIQHDRLVRVWGKGPMGETVTVSFAGQTATSAVIGEDDLWEVAFARPFAANPEGQQLKVTCSDGATITLDDVLVGNVWIAAGQSNMVMPVKGSAYGDTYDADATVADMANHPQIRWMAMDIKYGQASTPEPYEVKGGAWGKAAKNLSAVAYHFAHDCVTAHPEIPVGIIGCYCNALSISYWKPGGTKTLWNCQLAPITRLAVRGALWYQGESDAWGTQIREHRHYGTDALEPMVAAWRREFGVEAVDFPFYFVQLAGYLNGSTADDPSGDNDLNYRAIRESMFWARRHIENCGMVVAWDCGRLKLEGEDDATCQHPKCKNVLGKRLARLALRNVYGDNIVAESPYWTETETDGIGNIRVKFDMNGSAGFTTALKNWNDAAWPVKTTGEALKGFAVAGSDKVWHWANAVIESADTIRLSSPDVAKPLYVRYCYRCNPVGGIANGYNAEMLPIAPIATEYAWYADVRKEGAPEPSVAVLPTAKTNLKYNGQTQTGVPAGTGYRISGNTGTDAKGYTATLTLADGYGKWSDDSTAKTRTIAWSIAKGANKWTTNPSVTPATWTEGSAPETITFANGANTFGAAVTCDTDAATLKALKAGESKTVTFTAAADGDNYDTITFEVTVKVTAGEDPEPLGEDWGYSNKVTVAGADYMIVVFTNTAKEISWTLPANVTTFDYLVVGGGGAGGYGQANSGGGGGGAGAGREGALTVEACASLTVKVGEGGKANKTNSKRGEKGGDSSLAVAGGEEVSVLGGGGGAGTGFIPPSGEKGGETGGCGGGGTGCTSTGFNQGGGLGSNYGQAGGNGANSGAKRSGGGGGGIQEAGSKPATVGSGFRGGLGGAGLTSSITGSEVVYGGGGGGGNSGYNESGNPAPYAPGGAGGGGHGGGWDPETSAYALATSGTDGLGGGGGGSSGTSTKLCAGNGGSGVVIIRYALGGEEPEQPKIDPSKGGGVTVKAARAADAIAKVTVATPEGVTNPEYATYFELVATQAGEGAWLVTAELKVDAVRPEIGGTESDAAFVVGDEGVTLRVVNAKAGLYYGYKSSDTLAGLKDAKATGLQLATEGGERVLTPLKDGEVRFYQVVVAPHARGATPAPCVIQ